MAMAIVLDAELAPGVAANAAAVLAMSIGKKHPEWVGEDLVDGAGSPHPGLTAHAIPVLRAAAEELGSLRERALGRGDLWTVGFTETARRAREYRYYAAELAAASPSELRYVGVALVGEREAVRALTSALPLFR
jgi:hypothetical protein